MKDRFTAIACAIFVILTMTFDADVASARPEFLVQFLTQYGSAPAGCQQCHSNPGGGAPWNAYGRDLLANGGATGPGGNIVPVLLEIELLNSDGVEGNNVVEIQAGAQPGWCDPTTPSCVNQSYRDDGVQLGLATPPLGILLADTLLPDPDPPAPQPRITVAGGPIAFGTVFFGLTRERAVTIANTGTADLTLGAVSVNGPGFASALAPTSPVPPGGSTDLIVRFSPIQLGPANGILTIPSNDPDRPSFAVNLSGVGTIVQPPVPAPNISLSRVAVDFGAVLPGVTREQTVTIANTGTADLTLDASVLGSGYSLLLAPTSPVPAGGSTDVTVRFSPVQSGAAAGSLTIASNDPDTPSVTVNLSGVGLPDPEPNIAVSALTVDFGAVFLGVTRERTVTIANTGTADLTLDASVLGTGYSLLLPPTSPVPPGGSTDVTVRFSPIQSGAATGSLTIASNDPDTPSVTVDLRGQGVVVPPDPEPNIAVSLVAVDFGAVLPGVTEERTVTINNTGTADLTLNAVSVTGPGFDLPLPPTSPVPAGGSTDLTVSFSPIQIGAAAGSLTIASNDPDTPSVTVDLSGVGLPAPEPDIAVALVAVDFGAVLPGVTEERTVTINNNGTADLTLDAVSVTGPGFDLPLPPTSPVPAGGSTDLTVSFSPIQTGAAIGSLTIASNDPDTPSVTVDLSGVGLPAPEPDIAVALVAVDFGAVLPGVTEERTVTINNNGTADLRLDAVSVTGPGFGLPLLPTSPVPAGGSTDLTVSFSPIQTGIANGLLTITSNDPDTPSVTVDLRGEGIVDVPDPDIAQCPVGTRVDDPFPAGIAQGAITVGLETIATGLVNPVFATVHEDDRDRLFVLDQPGQVWAIDLATLDRTRTLFLDVSTELVELGLFGIGYDERGLLGMAFHPEFFENGLVYTYQSMPADRPADFTTLPDWMEPDHQSALIEWRVSDPSDPYAVIDPASRREIFRVDQPQFNHNGGSLAFDDDDLLYISLGDGGNRDDEGLGHSPQGNGQDTSNVLGAILRIDPLGDNSRNGQYGIPGDNPFVASGADDGFIDEDDDDDNDGDGTRFGGQEGCADGFCDEIWAYGFRNPWRMSFDSDQDTVLIVSDVGQGDVEEVDIVEKGQNYGWRIKEGEFCFNGNGDGRGFVTDAMFDAGLLVDPVAQYDHDEGISVTGGYVYRGDIDELEGHYVFGDWAPSFIGPVSGRLFYLSQPDLANAQDRSEVLEFRLFDKLDVGSKINGFGQDADGEIYVLGSESGLLIGTTGIVQKIVAVPGFGDDDEGEDQDEDDDDTEDDDDDDDDEGDDEVDDDDEGDD